MDFTLTEDSQKYERGFRELLSERGYDCKSGIRVQRKKVQSVKLPSLMKKSRR